MSLPTTDPAGDRHRLRLDRVQETLVVPLCGRAVETRKPQGVLRDEKAGRDCRNARLTTSPKFDGGPSLLGTVLRADILDAWTREFLTQHPPGTVIELGTGLSSRYGRLDHSTCHWYDPYLPRRRHAGCQAR